MKKSKWRHFKNKWVIALTIVILIIAGISYARSGSGAPRIESATAKISDVAERVSVTGTISPATKSDLSFKKGGVITAVYVKVGDRVVAGQPIASLDSETDRASLRAAQAILAEKSRTLTAEELAVQKTSLDNAEKEAKNAAVDGLAKAQAALFTYADTFFSNAQSPNPTISLRTDGQYQATDINQKRLIVTTVLKNWADDIASYPLVDSATLVSHARDYLTIINDFMNQLSNIVNALNTTNSGLTQAAINSHIATVNSGLASLNTAITSVTGAQTSLATARSNYNLKLAGNSSQTIAAESARVQEAQAQVDAATLRSPIDGIVTKAIPNVGEYVSSGQSGFSVQNSNFKIEANVPEADIAKIKVGDLASTTLDAYGSRVDFPARVISIDPAETILEGVPTYKVTLTFIEQDQRIRSGMTANLDILTNFRTGVLAIPYRALTDEGSGFTVRRLDVDGRTWAHVPVMTGLKGSDGNIEIISGIVEGDRVVTYIK